MECERASIRRAGEGTLLGTLTVCRMMGISLPESKDRRLACRVSVVQAMAFYVFISPGHLGLDGRGRWLGWAGPG